MPTTAPSPQQLVTSLTDVSGAVGRRLDRVLSSTRGISFADYRLLAVLAAAGDGGLSRADLAGRVGLTPSGATRALRPLEKLGMVVTRRSPRDARLALAELTPAGREVVAQGSDAVDDATAALARRANFNANDRRVLADLLERLAGA